jgi:hypothetical protein
MEPPKRVASHFAEQCEAGYTAQTFADLACYTRDNPAAVFERRARYQRPKCLAGEQVAEDQKRRLRDAYDAAPDYVQKKLCALTRHDGHGNDCAKDASGCRQLFIKKTDDAADSWGLWEAPDKRPARMGKAVFLAVSEVALRDQASLADGENGILKRLGLLPPGDIPKDLPSYASANPSGSALATLAVIAHELGHVLLADGNVDGVERNHPRRVETRDEVGDPTSFCFASEFLRRTWDPDGFRGAMKRWVSFGDTREVNHRHRKDPRGTFSWRQVRRSVARHRHSEAAERLKPMFERREFVSFLAALRPEEDVVETYKYKVLIDARIPLKGLELAFPGDTRVNIVEIMNSEDIQKKIACLRELEVVPR